MEVMAVPKADTHFLAKPGRDDEEQQASGLTGPQVDELLHTLVEEGWLKLSECAFSHLDNRGLGRTDVCCI